MDKYVELTAQVISDFVSSQHINPADLPAAIEATYKALWECGNPAPKFEPEVQKRRRRNPQRTIAPVAETQEQTEGPGGSIDDIAVAQGETYGWDEHGQRIIPEPMFE